MDTDFQGSLLGPELRTAILSPKIEAHSGFGVFYDARELSVAKYHGRNNFIPTLATYLTKCDLIFVLSVDG